MNRLFNNKKVIIVLILLVIGIPLTVFLALKQQEVRSGASGEQTSFDLSPQTDTKNIGQNFAVHVFINAGNYSISGVNTLINIDKNKVDFVSFAPTTSFDHVLINNYSVSTGTLQLSAVNINNIATGRIDIGTLTLHAKAAGVALLNFSPSSQVVGLGQQNQLSVATNITGSYTISTPPTPTPTPSHTPTPTPTPTAQPPGCAKTPNILAASTNSHTYYVIYNRKIVNPNSTACTYEWDTPVISINGKAPQAVDVGSWSGASNNPNGKQNWVVSYENDQTQFSIPANSSITKAIRIEQNQTANKGQRFNVVLKVHLVGKPSVSDSYTTYYLAN